MKHNGRSVSAIAVERTENRKVGPVSVTMASQASCPKECPWLKSGCYAESGPQAIHTARLNRSEDTKPEDIARVEVEAIARLSGTRPLRLHVVGDARTTRAVRILARGIAKYMQPVWTYTHAWRMVARNAWGRISVLASCETTAQVKQARAMGYATAMVVPEFPMDRAYMVDDIKVVLCPQQTGRTEDCSTCKLCWDDARLVAMGVTIGFMAHGSKAKSMQARLIQIGATI